MSSATSEHRVLYRSGIMIIIALRVSPLSLCVCIYAWYMCERVSRIETSVSGTYVHTRPSRDFTISVQILVGEEQRVAHCAVQPAPSLSRPRAATRVFERKDYFCYCPLPFFAVTRVEATVAKVSRIPNSLAESLGLRFVGRRGKTNASRSSQSSVVRERNEPAGDRKSVV